MAIITGTAIITITIMAAVKPHKIVGTGPTMTTTAMADQAMSTRRPALARPSRSVSP